MHHLIFDQSSRRSISSGDATSFEPFQGTEHNAFNGLCLVIIGSSGKSGKITLQAGCEPFKSGRVTVQAK